VLVTPAFLRRVQAEGIADKELSGQRQLFLPGPLPQGGMLPRSSVAKSNDGSWVSSLIHGGVRVCQRWGSWSGGERSEPQRKLPQRCGRGS
jgi:hypothetical protein